MMMKMIAAGCDEIDMVMNVARFKSGRVQAVADGIAQVVRAVPGIPVKVILETCLLSDEEKARASRISKLAGADYVKTSTGFHPAGGASVDAVRIMAEQVTFDENFEGVIRGCAEAHHHEGVWITDQFIRAYAELHREVARKMWHNLWPDRKVEEVPIKYVTNGIHTGTWLARRLGHLLIGYKK